MKFFSFFHLNLAFSSIEATSRVDVLRKCYDPLLELISNEGCRIALEIPGWTLEQIQRLSPEWVQEFRNAINQGKTELIGSGYSQIIAPLVPYHVNSKNLSIGKNVYQEILGVTPPVWLVSEQAYSSGILGSYLENGASGIIADWDNSYSSHHWPAGHQFSSQVAVGPGDSRIAVLWSRSANFQQFQRVIYGDTTYDEYLDYVENLGCPSEGVIGIYGNDAEIFDFRPGRYVEEPAIDSSEWNAVKTVHKLLESKFAAPFLLPSEILASNEASKENCTALKLESPQYPIQVKKQPKYNIARWAVTGRDDYVLNSTCHSIARVFRQISPSDGEWRRLLELWASDFRTHITEARWHDGQARLEKLRRDYPGDETVGTVSAVPSSSAKTNTAAYITEDRDFIQLGNGDYELVLNKRRGLSIRSFIAPEVSEHSLLGTIRHGFFNNISLAADWYSGHSIIESMGHPRITDLVPVKPRIINVGDAIEIEGTFEFDFGSIVKRISLGGSQQGVQFNYKIELNEFRGGRIRVGHITLMPQAFAEDQLNFSTHNGGKDAEIFDVDGNFIDHGRSISFLVSSTSGLAMTEGWLDMGDQEKRLVIELNNGQGSPLSMFSYQHSENSFLSRLAFSLCENDDTSLPGSQGRLTREFSFNLSARTNDS